MWREGYGLPCVVHGTLLTHYSTWSKVHVRFWDALPTTRRPVLSVAMRKLLHAARGDHDFLRGRSLRAAHGLDGTQGGQISDDATEDDVFAVEVRLRVE